MKHAFSLVELSIVLVILGLLTGGILTGANLIRAAELRSIGTDYKSYKTAMFTFRDKYFYLPGDMPNATDFWEAAGAGGTGATCFNADSSGGKSCNGNGDGAVFYPSGATGTEVWTWGERFQFWTHLANAGMIEGSYIGKTDSASTSYVATAGLNVPASKVSGGIYDMYHSPSVASVIRFPNMNGVNLMTAMQPSGIGIIVPEEVWNIDMKFDDGKPGTGYVGTTLSTSPGTPNCSTTNDPATSEYNLASTVKCKMYFNMD